MFGGFEQIAIVSPQANLIIKQKLNVSPVDFKVIYFPKWLIVC